MQHKINIRSIIKKLYKFITILIQFMEQEMVELHAKDNFKNTIIVRKNITDNLHKLIVLISRLNKLHQENIPQSSKKHMSSKDQEIIDNFLAKYMNH